MQPIVQTILSIFSVQPATAQVARSHTLLYLKSDNNPNSAMRSAKSATTFGNLTSKLDLLGSYRQESTKAIAKHLSNAEAWLDEVKKAKPNAIVYARKTRQRNGDQESTAVTLYIKSRPNNFLSRWIDSVFYSDDKALAEETLSALASRLAPTGSATSSIMPGADSTKQRKSSSDGISIEEFSKRINEQKEIALKQATLEAALFDPDSTLRKHLSLAIGALESSQQSNTIVNKFRLLVDSEKELAGTHGLSSGSVTAFKKFVEGLEANTIDGDIDQKFVLNFCEDWEARYNIDPNFKTLVESNPSLAKWNKVSLIVARRVHYFDVTFDDESKKFFVIPTAEYSKFVEDAKERANSNAQKTPLKMARELIGTAGKFIGEVTGNIKIDAQILVQKTKNDLKEIGTSAKKIILTAHDEFAQKSDIMKEDLEKTKSAVTGEFKQTKDTLGKIGPRVSKTIAASGTVALNAVQEATDKVGSAMNLASEATSVADDMLAESIKQATQEVQKCAKRIECNVKNIGKDETQIQNEENVMLLAARSEDPAKKISEEKFSNQVTKKRKKKLREVNFENFDFANSQMQVTKKKDLTETMPAAEKASRTNRQELSDSEINGGVAHDSYPLSVKPYLQAEDWENGEMFVCDQTLPAHATIEISEDVFKAVRNSSNRSPKTSDFSTGETKNKKRIIILTDEVQSQDINDQLAEITEIYLRAGDEARNSRIKELVVMPCYPQNMSEDHRKRAEMAMVKTLFLSISSSPEMRIRLIARSPEEEKTLDASIKNIARHF